MDDVTEELVRPVSADVASTVANEGAETEIPKIKDPKVYLNNFYKSPEYKDALDQFMEGKTPSPAVTEEQIRKAFLSSEKAEYALFKFYKNGTQIVWDSAFYTPEIAKAWSDYRKTIYDMKKLSLKGNFNRQELTVMDAVRSEIHSQTARMIVDEEIAPNQLIGRSLVKLMTISCGLESMGAGSVSRSQQIASGLGAKAAA